MDMQTGVMFSNEEFRKKSPEQQKSCIFIPDKFLPEIEGMNRHQRRAWLKINRDRIENYNQEKED